ncbi:hypothetical protein R3I94_003663 [Phoxinus phoxinus]
MATPAHLGPAHSPEYKCCGPTLCDNILTSLIQCPGKEDKLKMSKKPGWPPVLPKRDQERREKLRQRLEGDFATTVLRVSKAEALKARAKFSRPYWPPLISSEEKERRRLFRQSLEKRSSPPATPSTSQRWPPEMKTVKVSVPPCASLAVLPPPSAVAKVALKRVPRATAWRRKKRAQEDIKALKQGKATARRRDPRGYPCSLCGKPKRLEFGHSFFRGKAFCATSAGKTVSQWLSEQRRVAAADNVSDVPRTTAWRRKKKQEAISLGLPQKRPKKCTPITCSLCQQPKTKEFGHSRYGGKAFCSSHEGKTVELWLAEQRALAPTL